MQAIRRTFSSRSINLNLFLKTAKTKGKAKAKTGPKTNWKMTKAVLGKLEQAFAIDATIREACFYADINEDTYYRWVKEDPKLSEKFSRLRQKPVLTARQSVVGNLKDPEFALKYLKNKKNKEFNERQINKQDGSIKLIVTDKRAKQIEKAIDNI